MLTLEGQRRMVAERIADALFVNGAEEKTGRLVLELLNGKYGGAWCKEAAIDQIERVLEDMRL